MPAETRAESETGLLASQNARLPNAGFGRHSRPYGAGHGRPYAAIRSTAVAASYSSVSVSAQPMHASVIDTP